MKHPIQIYHKCAPINKNVRCPKAADDQPRRADFNLLPAFYLLLWAIVLLSNQRVISMRGENLLKEVTKILRWRRVSKIHCLVSNPNQRKSETWNSITICQQSIKTTIFTQLISKLLTKPTARGSCIRRQALFPRWILHKRPKDVEFRH